MEDKRSPRLAGHTAAACTGLLLFFCLWGALGQIPQKVTGQGVLVNGAGSVLVYAPVDGVVTDLSVRENMVILPGDTLARIQTAAGEVVPVRAPQGGRIVSIEPAIEKQVRAGDALGRILVQSDNADLLSVVCYLPLADVGRVTPGMEMAVYLAGVNTNDTGYMRALVTDCSHFPAMPSQVAFDVGSDALAQAVLENAPAIAVRGALLKDTASQNSYLWSSRNGGSVLITDGMLVEASVTVGYDSPFVLAMPFLKKLLAGGVS